MGVSASRRKGEPPLFLETSQDYNHTSANEDTISGLDSMEAVAEREIKYTPIPRTHRPVPALMRRQ